MFRRLLLFLIFASVASACAVASESGDAPEPVLSGVPAGVPATTEAGVAALSNASIDPNTCAGVLGDATGTHSRQTQSLTSTVQSSEQQIEAMCTASYETQIPGDPFLIATLIKFDSDDPAIARYEMIKEGFVVNDMPISEVKSAAEGLTDRLSVLIDGDGMGRISTFRKKNWSLTISVGPTTDASPWKAGDIDMIGMSIIERLQN